MGLPFVLQKLTTNGPQYAHIGGELSSLKDQVETLESDLAEFENVNRRYKDQLVKVKVGYGLVGPHNFTLTTPIHRCLTWRITISRSTPRRWTSMGQVSLFERGGSPYHFSAIMKYHSLKMEEVNDTMKHLWNKTYQGTGSYPFHPWDACLDTNLLGFRH